MEGTPVKKHWLPGLLAVALIGSAPLAFAEDRSGEALTPMDQGTSAEDVRITQAIRKAVVADDALSMDAENVKIITVDGVVTLRGEVETAQERTSIEAKAKSVAGVTRVDNQLEIDSPDVGANKGEE
jgi:osmotically-inducible protein OsmY